MSFYKQRKKRGVSAENNRERRRSVLNVRGCTSIYNVVDGLDQFESYLNNG
jgi:hypothetical protein